MSHLQIATIESQQFDNHEAALPFAHKAMELAPQLYVSHFVLGRILLKMGRAEAAVKELEAASNLAPDSVMIHHMLLTAYNKTHRRDAAAREQEILKKLQQFESAWKGQASDTELSVGVPPAPPGP
jgi:predicted Zn-dependent protease